MARLDDEVVLSPVGELDHAALPTLADVLTRLPKGTERVVADMAGVSFMDTAGLLFIARLRRHGRRAGATTAFVHWGSQPLRVLELADVSLDADARKLLS